MAVVSIFKKLYLNLIFIVLAILKTIKMTTNKNIYIHIYISFTSLRDRSDRSVWQSYVWSSYVVREAHLVLIQIYKKNIFLKVS